MNDVIEFAIKSGRCFECRDEHLYKARASLVVDERRRHTKLARDYNRMAIGWLRLAKKAL
jgi:hypothetical protein